MNRTTHILNAINDRLNQLDFTIYRTWKIEQFNEYDFPYCHARVLGESTEIPEYEDGYGSQGVTSLRIDVIVGYGIDSDTSNEGLFENEEAERIHQVRQHLDNGGFVIDDYEDTKEQVQIGQLQCVGYSGVTMDNTETKGVSVIGFLLNFQAIKKYD